MENRLAALLNAAQAKNPAAFKQAFHAEAMTRVAHKIELMKPTVITSVLGTIKAGD